MKENMRLDSDRTSCWVDDDGGPVFVVSEKDDILRSFSRTDYERIARDHSDGIEKHEFRGLDILSIFDEGTSFCWCPTSGKLGGGTLWRWVYAEDDFKIPDILEEKSLTKHHEPVALLFSFKKANSWIYLLRRKCFG